MSSPNNIRFIGTSLTGQRCENGTGRGNRGTDEVDGPPTRKEPMLGTHTSMSATTGKQALSSDHTKASPSAVRNDFQAQPSEGRNKTTESGHKKDDSNIVEKAPRIKVTKALPTLGEKDLHSVEAKFPHRQKNPVPPTSRTVNKTQQVPTVDDTRTRNQAVNNLGVEFQRTPVLSQQAAVTSPPISDSDAVAEQQLQAENYEVETTWKREKNIPSTTSADITDDVRKSEKQEAENNGKINENMAKIEEAAAERRTRYNSMQDTSSQEDVETEKEDSDNQTVQSPESEISLMTITGASAFPTKRDIAEQSCRENDYTPEQIENAKSEYQQLHGAAREYSGSDLVLLIMKKEDEIKDPPVDSNPPALEGQRYNLEQYLPDQQNLNSGYYHREYTVIATVRDEGHSGGGASNHNIVVDVQIDKTNCCDKPNVSLNCRFK